uniref:Uncharacterized protein n=1 Tax=Oryza punctata TaxID=4537 RepID=A0A0E0M637_ORYPU
MAKKTTRTMLLGSKGKTTTTTSTQLHVDVVVGGPLAVLVTMYHELGHNGSRWQHSSSSERVNQPRDGGRGGSSPEMIEGGTYNNCNGG